MTLGANIIEIGFQGKYACVTILYDEPPNILIIKTLNVFLDIFIPLGELLRTDIFILNSGYQNIVEANNGKGYGWNRIEIKNIRSTKSSVRYGVSTKSSFTGTTFAGQWVSTADFNLNHMPLSHY